MFIAFNNLQLLELNGYLISSELISWGFWHYLRIYEIFFMNFFIAVCFSFIVLDMFLVLVKQKQTTKKYMFPAMLTTPDITVSKHYSSRYYCT